MIKPLKVSLQLIKILKTNQKRQEKPIRELSYQRVNTYWNHIKYCFGFFKGSWKNKEYAITQEIKKTTTSQQLRGIIKIKGDLMNIVHLTAILDRMQEQEMIQTKDIVQFTIERIKIFHQIFTHNRGEWNRTICNITCYLGNIKNKSINYLLQKVNYKSILKNSKNIQKAMLITGLIRLGLFDSVFTIAQLKKRDDKISFEEIITQDFNLNHILSIWFSILNEPPLINDKINRYFQRLINSGKYKSDGLMTLRQFAYALICYTQSYQSLVSKESGFFYKIIEENTPFQVKSSQYLMPYQLTWFLFAMKKIKLFQKNREKGATINVHLYSINFKDILNANILHIYKKKNTTLRNLANILKNMDQLNIMYLTTTLQMVNRTKLILQQEIKHIEKSQVYQFDFKVDLLSLCSLNWKIYQFYYKNRNTLTQTKILFEQCIRAIANYIITIQKISKFDKLSTNQLLMLYSGFFFMSRTNHQTSFTPQISTILIEKVMLETRKLTLKQLTLFFTYSKQLQSTTPKFCKLIKQSVDNFLQISSTNNQVALKIHNKKGCLMDLGQKCMKCFCLDQKQKVEQSIKQI